MGDNFKTLSCTQRYIINVHSNEFRIILFIHISSLKFQLFLSVMDSTNTRTPVRKNSTRPKNVRFINWNYHFSDLLKISSSAHVLLPFFHDLNSKILHEFNFAETIAVFVRSRDHADFMNSSRFNFLRLGVTPKSSFSPGSLNPRSTMKSTDTPVQVRLGMACDKDFICYVPSFKLKSF